MTAPENFRSPVAPSKTFPAPHLPRRSGYPEDFAQDSSFALPAFGIAARKRAYPPPGIRRPVQHLRDLQFVLWAASPLHPVPLAAPVHVPPAFYSSAT